MFLSLTMKKVYLTAFVLVSSLGQPMPLFKKAQEDAAKIIGMSLRTYVSYEQDETKADQLKLERMIEKLNEFASKETSGT